MPVLKNFSVAFEIPSLSLILHTGIGISERADGARVPGCLEAVVNTERVEVRGEGGPRAPRHRHHDHGRGTRHAHAQPAIARPRPLAAHTHRHLSRVIYQWRMFNMSNQAEWKYPLSVLGFMLVTYKIIDTSHRNRSSVIDDSWQPVKTNLFHYNSKIQPSQNEFLLIDFLIYI